MWMNLYDPAPHFRNRWKGRVLAGATVFVFNLFLAVCVIYMWDALCAFMWPVWPPNISAHTALIAGVVLIQCMTVIQFFFLLFFLFLFFSPQVWRMCWLVEMFGRWFWKEWVRTLVVAPQLLPLYLHSSFRVWLWAGHTVLLGYSPGFEETQTKSILRFNNAHVCGRKLELSLQREAVSSLLWALESWHGFDMIMSPWHCLVLSSLGLGNMTSNQYLD